MGIYKVENRIYWIDPKVIDAATGRAVGADNLTNTAGFAGQVFFNPERRRRRQRAESRLRRSVTVPDRYGAFETLPIPGRYGIEFKGEAFNLTNTPSFTRQNGLDMDINSTTFGRLNNVNVASRVIQISARFDF